MLENNSLEFIITLNPLLLWAFFAIVLLIVLFVSIMLVYHWKEYSLDKRVFSRAITIYFTVVAVLIGLAIVSAIGFSFSLA